MVKYYNSMVVFEEIPNEITLAINITICPCHCKGCHSQFLWEDVGTELTFEELDKLIERNDGITCVCFMGGDRDPKEINDLAEHILYTPKYDGISVAWYSGMDEISKDVDLELFRYIKIGHYDEEFGGLNKKTTNQRLYEVFVNDDKEFDLKDITSKFWK